MNPRARTTGRLLVRNARVALDPAVDPPASSYSVLCRDGRIEWVGPDRELPTADIPHNCPDVDADGRLLTPGLIDCHTHLLHAGSRAHEFEQRLEGVPYHEIAAAGGGILSTVRSTRASTDAALLDGAAGRLADLARQGVTTVEIKSGYALSVEGELRMLRLTRELSRRTAQRIVPTLLAAHAIPPEFAHDRGGYVRAICEEMIPVAASEGLATSVDAFCEQGAFTLEECRAVFAAATRHGLAVRLHAEQFTHSRGAELAAKFNALSADHLEYLDEAGARAMAESGTVAVLLPGAQMTLALPAPPVGLLRVLRVPISLATDNNPGSSNTTNLLLMMQLGAVFLRLMPGECLAAVTTNAAKALGLAQVTGTIRPGLEADLVLWEVETFAELVYPLGRIPEHQTWQRATPLEAPAVAAECP